MSGPTRVWRTGVWVVLPALVALAGCGGDARVELATADALDSLAAAMAATVAEYHEEVESADAARESAAIDALVARIVRDAGDADACRAHADAFERALARINADRRVEATRHFAALDNAEVLREIGAGLRRVALDSMALEDEARRYVLSLLEAWQAAQVRTSAPPSDANVEVDLTKLVAQGR
jgi:hypothetical protein